MNTAARLLAEWPWVDGSVHPSATLSLAEVQLPALLA